VTAINEEQHKVEYTFFIYEKNTNETFVSGGEGVYSGDGRFESLIIDKDGTLNLSSLIEYIKESIQESAKKEKGLNIQKENIHVQINKIIPIN